MNVLDRLAGLPRVRLGHGITPLEPLPNLAAELGARQAWVKRDDCTGLAFGGNKVRQLEFYMGEALARKADTVLITGAVQSNFVRSAAAAAAKLGLACHVQLEDRTPRSDATYRTSGNVLLDRMLGATIHYYAEGEDESGADAALEALAEQLTSDGRRPYVIHLAPVHPPLGALGYVVCAAEIVAQSKTEEVKIDRFVVASGSAATHTGLLFGLRALGCQTPVIGACVRRDAEVQAARVKQRCADLADLLGISNPVPAEDVILSDAHFAPGYGRYGDSVAEAIRLAARSEALLLDPVYTGKSAAEFISQVRANPGETHCLIHTGGGPGIFAYANELSAISD